MKNGYLRQGSNIKDILRKFALDYKISELLLDYSLVSYSTYYIDDNASKKTIIDNAKINSYIDTAYNIKQEYAISIFKRQSSFYPIIIQLHTNENETKLQAHIYTQRIPQDKSNLEVMIQNTILNICAYRGIIIGLGWNNIKPHIIDIASKLRENGNHPEYYSIDISSLAEPQINSIAVKLILSKSEKKSILSHDSQLQNGGFFRVESGEILLDYSKPHYNSPWRNIYGDIYGIGKAYPIGIFAGDGIDVSEVDNKIIYTANKDGYASIVRNVMLISDTVTLDSINQKSVQNIKEQAIDTLIVKNDNLTKDVVTSGLTLEVDNLNITGNVGAANIVAKDLFINGQVHIKSNIKSIKSSILYLKGNLESRFAQIRYCENGMIKSDDLLINFLNGSKIYCSRGKISQIKSNNNIYIQESLLIGSITGKHNEFTLYPCLYGEEKVELDTLNAQILSLNKLKNIFLNDKNKLNDEKIKNELLYDELCSRNTSYIDNNLYDWDKNVLDKQHLKLESSIRILSKYNNLIDGLDENINKITQTIKDRLNKMFDISITFINKCNIDFYVRFINIYGIESRIHINANNDNMIKKVMLSKGEDEDSIKVLCYKE